MTTLTTVCRVCARYLYGRMTCRAFPILLAVFCAAVATAQNPEPTREVTAVRRYVGADYSYAWFHGDIDPWQLAAISVGRRGPRGSVIGRANLAQRFGSNGAQVELDAYPRIRPGMYAYLNVGYSNDNIFPQWRSGGELFSNLPRAWEASLGYRQLRFGGAPVTLLTGSLGKYVGNSWLSLRPYVRVKPDGVSASLGITGRKYGADADNYLGARISAGTSPSDRADPTEIARTSSWSASLQGSRSLRPGLFGTWSLGMEQEELSSTTTRKKLEGSFGLRTEF